MLPLPGPAALLPFCFLPLPLQLIDEMLHKDRLFTISLPRLPSRVMLERAGQLEPRISVLDEEFDEAALEVRCSTLLCGWQRGVRGGGQPAAAACQCVGRGA
jgi:hypothetical protein